MLIYVHKFDNRRTLATQTNHGLSTSRSSDYSTIVVTDHFVWYMSTTLYQCLIYDQCAVTMELIACCGL